MISTPFLPERRIANWPNGFFITLLEVAPGQAPCLPRERETRVGECHSPVNVAVIGCGQWGFNHVRIFSALRASRVVAVADVEPERLRRVQEMFPAVCCERDGDRVLARADVDAVVVATPVSTHYDLVRQALERDKHVFCEKPLCETAVQAQLLADLAHARGLVLMVGHVFLFNAGILKLKELLDSGEMGAVYYLSAVRTNLGPIRSDVNAAYDLATHDISIFNWLLGSVPEFVSATGSSFLQPGVEDVAFISLKYPGGVLASVHASWLSPKKVRQLTLVGSRRMATWDDLEQSTPVAIFDKGANLNHEYREYSQFLRLAMWDGDVRLPKIHQEEPLRVENHYFIEGVKRGRIERSDGAFGVGVVRTLEAVSKSLRDNGCSVRLAA